MNGRVTILGIPIDNVSASEAVERIAGFCVESGAARLVVTPNPEMLVMARRDEKFRRLLQASDLNLPDGQGLLWAARLGGKPLKERVTGTDMVERLAAAAAIGGRRVFLLGAAPGVAQAAADQLRTRHRGLLIATHDGGSLRQDASGNWRVNEAAEAMIRDFAPQLLFVGFGQVRQEFWLRDNLARFPSVRVGMGVGGAFDFWSGTVVRAPLWMRKAGLEWLWRLVVEPRRWRRILNAVMVFPWLVITGKKC